MEQKLHIISLLSDVPTEHDINRDMKEALKGYDKWATVYGSNLTSMFSQIKIYRMELSEHFIPPLAV